MRKSAITALPIVIFFIFISPGFFGAAWNNASMTAGPWSGLQVTPLIWAAAKKIYYDPTVKNIIQSDCGRCHSGATRNLMDYDSLKAYAESGMLGGMVQGSMGRFAGKDAQTIIGWVNSGAKEKPPAGQVHFFSGFSAGGGHGPTGCPRAQVPVNVPADQITYENTIQYILAQDCLRCHSGQFRNLTTYRNVKLYVDNGLLKILVDMGGPMHRFAGPDSRKIIAWINNGAPM